ncbi:BRCT domain-containing protein [Denitromonas iodatirespirans]|uniref:BRCT domain-containing protein n=1 Tax=Denitromonas iodatirespirans TaxID=2795389 RepID=A0A944DBZ5_DENI1|nr:BRCT domain-containing protein [Denitromonas iodatirespirans]MBT0962637.1 BRCT domain-containing protein [Denitromonas iodatirespirans]
MHPDHSRYANFTSRARLEKSVNSLLGLVEGITIDCAINQSEIAFLNLWLSEHADVSDRHPYNELVPVVQAAVADGVLTREEHDDIVWLCERLRSTEYFDETTADLQRLHAILGGIVSDGQITEAELEGLSGWLTDHEHLRTCWPYDEIDSLIVGVMNDRKIDDHEHALLKSFFSEFVAIMDDRTINRPIVSDGTNIIGLCAVCPEIEFTSSTFCFTGASSRYTRSELAATVERLGGTFAPNVTKGIKYLVIGADGNPCWAYACYGRKVEKAVQLRKSGVRVLIIHENDFHDAVADAGQRLA